MSLVEVERNRFVYERMEEIDDHDDIEQYISVNQKSRSDPTTTTNTSAINSLSSSSSSITSLPKPKFLFAPRPKLPTVIDLSSDDDIDEEKAKHDDDDEQQRKLQQQPPIVLAEVTEQDQDDQQQQQQEDIEIKPSFEDFYATHRKRSRSRRLFDKQEYDDGDHNADDDDDVIGGSVLSDNTRSVIKKIKLEIDKDDEDALLNFSSSDESNTNAKTEDADDDNDEMKWHERNMSMIAQNDNPSPLPSFDDTKTPITITPFSTDRLDFFSRQFDRIWSSWFSYRVPESILSQSEREYRLYRYNSSSKLIPSLKLSDLFGVAITISGQRFASVSHYYQWMKQNWIGRPELRESAMDLIVEDSTRVLLAMDKADINSDILLMLHKVGLGANKIALQCDKQVRDDEEYAERSRKWNEDYGQGERVLLRACLQKFVRNPHFCNILKQTGNAYLSCAPEGKNSNSNNTPLSPATRSLLKWNEICVDLANPMVDVNKNSFEYKSMPKRKLRDSLFKEVFGENKCGKMLMFIRDVVMPHHMYDQDEH